ncbi:MAG TPA: hypothetical protein VHQ92_05885 [Pseudolabrys sp.]|jgi:hypothetical protein|nr:hypothetical protein [Pseudolabrys sp.]
MTVPVRLENRAEAQLVRGAIHEYPLPAERRSETHPKLSTAELAFRIFAAFRAHPHINNVLTHIARANWAQAERSLNRILDLATPSDGLSLLEHNIIDLMCAERGITGKILKPYFHAALHRLLNPHHAELLIRHIDVLFLELEWKAQHPAPPPIVPSEPLKESGHARSEPH